MENRSVPRLFGPYVLTRVLGSDPLGGTFRAGTVGGMKLAPFLLIRAFDGVSTDRTKLVPAMETAVDYLDEVRGQAVAKGAVLGIVDDVPFAGIEYTSGQTLEQILHGQGETRPLPPEHALLIVEKILVSLEATQLLTRVTGAPHGFVVPSFVVVSYDGETRVFGAGLGKGLLPSLKNATARETFASYIAPEVAASGQPSVAGDLYSASAILYECLTGVSPIPGKAEGMLAGARLAGTSTPVPGDLIALLGKGLATDPASRSRDVTSFRRELDKVLYGGAYKASSFNLAFHLNQRYGATIESERREIAAEEAIDTARLKVAPKPAARPTAPPPVPTFGASSGGTSPGTSPGTGAGSTPGGAAKMLAIAGAVLVAGAAGIWFAFFRSPAAPPAKVVLAPTPVAMPTPLPTPAPIVVGKDDPIFQEALQKQLQEEMKRVDVQIQKEQEASARKRLAEQEKLAEEQRKAAVAESALRAATERASREDVARIARQALEARQREEAARAAAAAAVPNTKDGDLVELIQVDQQPQLLKVIKPEIPPVARRTKVSGTVILRVLVSESGLAELVEVSRDTTPKVGYGDSSVAAVKGWEWKPALKDGKRVKTWITVPVPFKL